MALTREGIAVGVTRSGLLGVGVEGGRAIVGGGTRGMPPALTPIPLHEIKDSKHSSQMKQNTGHIHTSQAAHWIYTRKMVPIPRRASSCLALAISIFLSSLVHLSYSLSCRFFSSSQPAKE